MVPTSIQPYIPPFYYKNVSLGLRVRSGFSSVYCSSRGSIIYLTKVGSIITITIVRVDKPLSYKKALDSGVGVYKRFIGSPFTLYPPHCLANSHEYPFSSLLG